MCEGLVYCPGHYEPKSTILNDSQVIRLIKPFTTPFFCHWFDLPLSLMSTWFSLSQHLINIFNPVQPSIFFLLFHYLLIILLTGCQFISLNATNLKLHLHMRYTRHISHISHISLKTQRQRFRLAPLLKEVIMRIQSCLCLCCYLWVCAYRG